MFGIPLAAIVGCAAAAATLTALIVTIAAVYLGGLHDQEEPHP